MHTSCGGVLVLKGLISGSVSNCNSARTPPTMSMRLASSEPPHYRSEDRARTVRRRPAPRVCETPTETPDEHRATRPARVGRMHLRLRPGNGPGVVRAVRGSLYVHNESETWLMAHG